MPRKARLTVPGALHHVMARGIEGRSIFTTTDDREYFLSLLSQGISHYGYKCYAWVLMDNHYHLLLRVNEKPLGEMMRHLNSKYARWYRKKNKNNGYLFQDRFKSIVSQDQGYLEQLVRYVHLNPIRAGICKTVAALNRYPWSGHAALVGTRIFPFQDTGAVLRRFSKDNRKAIAGYRDYIQAGVADDREENLIEYLRKVNKGISDRTDHHCWVIGDPEFVKKAMEHDRENRLRIAEYVKIGLTVEKISESVARQMKLDAEMIMNRGRQNDCSALRKIVAAISHREYGIPIVEIARYLGVCNSSVSRMFGDGTKLAAKNNISLKH